MAAYLWVCKKGDNSKFKIQNTFALLCNDLNSINIVNLDLVIFLVSRRISVETAQAQQVLHKRLHQEHLPK